MANARDDRDRNGNRITPQGKTPQGPQGRDDMNRDREQGGNRNERDRTPGSDSSRGGGRESNDFPDE
jgi:hypothetical protein